MKKGGREEERGEGGRKYKGMGVVQNSALSCFSKKICSPFLANTP